MSYNHDVGRCVRLLIKLIDRFPDEELLFSLGNFGWSQSNTIYSKILRNLHSCRNMTTAITIGLYMPPKICKQCQFLSRINHLSAYRWIVHIFLLLFVYRWTLSTLKLSAFSELKSEAKPWYNCYKEQQKIIKKPDLKIKRRIQEVIIQDLSVYRETPWKLNFEVKLLLSYLLSLRPSLFETKLWFRKRLNIMPFPLKTQLFL